MSLLRFIFVFYIYIYIYIYISSEKINELKRNPNNVLKLVIKMNIESAGR